jgi:hypothetical protein
LFAKNVFAIDGIIMELFFAPNKNSIFMKHATTRILLKAILIHFVSPSFHKFFSNNLPVQLYLKVNDCFAFNRNVYYRCIQSGV